MWTIEYYYNSLSTGEDHESVAIIGTSDTVTVEQDNKNIIIFAEYNWKTS